MAKTIELKLKAGDAAPKFTVATSGGGKISLADFKGQNVMQLLYLYLNQISDMLAETALRVQIVADTKKK